MQKYSSLQAIQTNFIKNWSFLTLVLMNCHPDNESHSANYVKTITRTTYRFHTDVKQYNYVSDFHYI